MLTKTTLWNKITFPKKNSVFCLESTYKWLMCDNLTCYSSNVYTHMERLTRTHTRTHARTHAHTHTIDGLLHVVIDL